MYKPLRWLFAILVICEESISHKYYYKDYGNNFEIYYGPYALGGFKEVKAPKSYKDGFGERGDRPGLCNNGQFVCGNKPYPISETEHFECLEDFQCPRFFKCCQPRCFQHKICQPSTYDSSEPTSTETASEVPVETIKTKTSFAKSTHTATTTMNEIRFTPTHRTTHTVTDDEDLFEGSGTTQEVKYTKSNPKDEYEEITRQGEKTSVDDFIFNTIINELNNHTKENNVVFSRTPFNNQPTSKLADETDTKKTQPTKIMSTMKFTTIGFPEKTINTAFEFNKETKVTRLEQISKSTTISETEESDKFRTTSGTSMTSETKTITTLEDDEDFHHEGSGKEENDDLLSTLISEKITIREYDKLSQETSLKYITTTESNEKGLPLTRDEDFIKTSDGKIYSTTSEFTKSDAGRKTSNKFLLASTVTTKKVTTLEDDEDFTEGSSEGEDYYELIEKLSTTVISNKTLSIEFSTDRGTKNNEKSTESDKIYTPLTTTPRVTITEGNDLKKSSIDEKLNSTTPKVQTPNIVAETSSKTNSISSGTTKTVIVTLEDDEDFTEGSSEGEDFSTSIEAFSSTDTIDKIFSNNHDESHIQTSSTNYMKTSEDSKIISTVKTTLTNENEAFIKTSSDKKSYSTTSEVERPNTVTNVTSKLNSMSSTSVTKITTTLEDDEDFPEGSGEGEEYYSLIDTSSSVDNAVSPVKITSTIGGSGNFTEVSTDKKYYSSTDKVTKEPNVMTEISIIFETSSKTNLLTSSHITKTTPTIENSKDFETMHNDSTDLSLTDTSSNVKETITPFISTTIRTNIPIKTDENLKITTSPIPHITTTNQITTHFTGAITKESENNKIIIHNSPDSNTLHNFIENSLPLFLASSKVKLDFTTDSTIYQNDKGIFISETVPQEIEVASDKPETAACNVKETLIPKHRKKENQTLTSNSDDHTDSDKLSIDKFEGKGTVGDTSKEYKSEDNKSKTDKSSSNSYSEVSKNITEIQNTNNRYTSDDEDDKIEGSGDYDGSGHFDEEPNPA